MNNHFFKNCGGLRAVAVIGDANDVNSWSNIPYFFLQAGKRAGFLQVGLKLEPKRQRYQRLLWNLRSPIRFEQPGGFQFSRYANEELFHQVDLTKVSEIISHFQLFPPSDLCQKEGITFSHYIDTPLSSLFKEYGVKIGHRTAQIALAREREQYTSARFVVCMSHWAARQVVATCRIPAHKVHVILPGANLPEAALQDQDLKTEMLSDPPDGKKIPLRLVFVGKDALRKGLGRLVDAVRILRHRGYRTVVRVIGPKQNLFPNDPEIEHVGFINKQHEAQRFVQELRSSHIGVLPSHQEAFGIAALEYLRCSLPALITNAGGLAETIPPDCGIVLDADCNGEDIASNLEMLLKDPERFQHLRRQAQLKSSFASWDRTIQDFINLWGNLENSAVPCFSSLRSC